MAIGVWQESVKGDERVSVQCAFSGHDRDHVMHVGVAIGSTSCDFGACVLGDGSGDENG